MTSIAKEAVLKGTNIDGDTVELQVPVRSKKATATNETFSFNRPKQNPVAGDARETRALNMNRIALTVQTEAKVSDEYADKNHNGNGDRPNISNKEEWVNEVWKLYVSGNILEYNFTNSDTLAETSEFSGYLKNMDWQEKAMSESSVYDVTLKMIDAIPMNS